jgi:hypothetical protein
MSIISRLKFNQNASMRFMLLNLSARSSSAFAQIFAITFFLKNLPIEQASLIILLLGYSAWFQLFELGLSQSIQNQFNLKKININQISNILAIHYLFLVLISIFVAKTALVSNLLLSNGAKSYQTSDYINFSLGASLLIISSSSNLLITKVLLLSRNPNKSNMLLFSQSIISVISLFLYSYFIEITTLNAILAYTFPQVITQMPFLLWLIKKRISHRRAQKHSEVSWLKFSKTTLDFLIINMLSTALLGLDYFYLSKYSTNEEMVAYHVTTRFFYLSFVVYFAYLTHAIRKFSAITSKKKVNDLVTIKKDTLQLGYISVISVFLLLIVLKKTGLFLIISNKVNISYQLIFMATFYFLIRVYSDINFAIANNLSCRSSLIKVYALQIAICLILMPSLANAFGACGVLTSLSIAYILGLSIPQRVQK